ncbi:MAG: PEGA domain-containing protein, partial [Candidatus Dojkabacteria bacterium]|nr:PEGA domain-containing protein [Candidatus Dojkabacteria bacterium]
MKKTLKTVLGIVVGPFLLIIGTLLTYFVAKGYRFDFDNGQFEQTGVISVETKPRRTEITLDGTAIGKSPKAVSGINEGKHTVTLSRNGYQTWTM